LETDKATIEVPSSVAGQVKEIKVKPGDKVKVGQTILSVDDGASSAGPVPPKPAEKSSPAKAEAAKADAETKSGPAKAGEAAQSASGGVGANTAAKIPSNGGLEQHVEGQKRGVRSDKPDVTEEDEDQPDNRPAQDSRKVVDISRGTRPQADGPSAPD